jgi:hypothetical protein
MIINMNATFLHLLFKHFSILLRIFNEMKGKVISDSLSLQFNHVNDKNNGLIWKVCKDMLFTL